MFCLAESGVPVSVNLIKMTKIAFKSPKSDQFSCFTVLALGCMDGRVLLHCIEQNGKHLFTCPKASSNNTEESITPRVVAIAFHPDCQQTSTSVNGRVNLKISILYTTGQLTEWIIPVVVGEDEEGQGDISTYKVESPVRDTWLQQFWTKIGPEWRRRMPSFHSMDYLTTDKWVLSSGTFIVYIDRTKVRSHN